MNKLKGKITQEGTNPPEIVLFEEAVIQIVSTEYLGEGSYKATLNVGILNNSYPPKWFISDSFSHKYAITPINTTEISIQAYEADGTEKDSILFGNVFEIDF